jgi:hypothetical protein
MNWQHVDPAPALLVLPPAAVSLDEANGAIEMWERYSRKTLDPSQRLVVQVMLAEGADGRWAARTTGREMPRQNGKGDEFEVVELWCLTQRGEAILHTAHELITVSKAHERLLNVLQHRDLRSKVRKVLNGLGQQMIGLSNGGIVEYRTRTKGGGRGLDDISRLIVDEAQHAEPEQLASSTPTMLANPNPQTNYVGTGGIAGMSALWWDVRKRALSDNPGQFGYVGHSAEALTQGTDLNDRPTVDASDRRLWHIANPALIAGRTDEAFLEEQLRNMGEQLFAREHLGVWDDPPHADGYGVIAADVWDAMKAERADIVSGETFALDISPDRKWSTFAVAFRTADGAVQVEAFDRRPGTSWVVDRAVKLWTDHRKPLRLEKGGPAGSFVSLLAERGVEVVEVSTADHARATGQFIDAALSGGLRHLGDPYLRAAVAGATLRHTGDADLWGRRASKVDITPLVACTLALGGVPAPAEAEFFVY